jgi:hypothetical protein
LVFECNGGGTTVGFVTEGHHVDAASLKIRLEQLVPGTVTVTEMTTLAGIVA